MGIKSFQGKRDTSRNNKIEDQILVADYMTSKLITFKAEDSLDHVITMLIKNKISDEVKGHKKINCKKCTVHFLFI